MTPGRHVTRLTVVAIVALFLGIALWVGVALIAPTRPRPADIPPTPSPSPLGFAATVNDWWHCQDPLWAPSPIETIIDTGATEACNASPLVHAMGFAVIGNQSVSAPVLGLLSAGSPSNVAGLVVTIVVDPIQTMIGRWTVTNIGQECLKALAPLFADRDATPTVTLIFFTCPLRVETAIFHPAPSMIFRSRQSLAGCTVTANADVTTGQGTVLGLTDTNALRRSQEVSAAHLTDAWNGTILGHRDNSLTRNRGVRPRTVQPVLGPLAFNCTSYQIGGTT